MVSEKHQKFKEKYAHPSDAIKRIIKQCQERHENPLASQKTRVLHPRDGYGKRYAQYSVSYTAGKSIDPEKLSRTGLGFLPIAASGFCPEKYGAEAGKDWETTYGVSDWKSKSWRKSYGVQIYTGKPSGYLTDLDFEYAIIHDHPQQFIDTLSRLCDLIDTPLLVISKSGGLRFSCRTPGYVHPKKEQIAVATWIDHSRHKNLYLEIFGEKGLSRYDARYEIYTGSLLEIPVIDPNDLFEIVDELREQIGEPRPEKSKATSKPTQTSEKQEKAVNAPSVKIVDGLPEGITWTERKDGSLESVRGDYPCQVTEHKKSKGAAQYYQQTNGQIDAFCHNCRQSWVVKRSDRTYTVSPKRLEINPTEQDIYKDTLHRPEENEASLQNAITNFLRHLESNHNDIPHYFILKYATGIGKSYGSLANAKKLGKKVLSLLFNHDLAAEQTHTAEKLGYNAYRFRGRSYNFKNSNLRSIPLQMRNKNETLFRSHQVMCPVYDELEPYQNKRLNPYMMCFTCPLLDACKSEGYWSQFPELRHADYLSACIQDIIFNPDFWTLLDTFLTGSVPFEIPETDEDTAIAAMLGLQDTDATQDFFQPFDFAMIDDYTTAGLYSEAHYTLEEIANLKNAWDGTHTGDVLKQIHKAIVLLYHDSTQHAMDILTELFDSLDDDTRETVNTNLTQHAHRDEDREVIPTAPWAALRNGIASLDTLTPVWHSKDWTLLHQLETIINHCQNTAQAPMFIDTDGRITLSIPPQVHPRIKAVLLMSATADIDSTKIAFSGQPVTFTATEGQPAHWAKGVKGFQYSNARWTTQSIFEYLTDENGKTVYDDDGKPIIVGLKPKAVEMLRKLTDLARTDNRKCVFISYKDFVEGEVAELEVVKALHEAFDTVTHYDIAPGMNFEGYKVFVTFGYPKVDPEVAKHEARVQFRHDPEHLNFDYTTTTEQHEVYSSTHGRYTNPRVENIRQQLATQKLQQGGGRARPTRWEDTITLAFTAEPVPGFTELATPFVDEDWQNTESFDLDAVIKVRRLAEQRAAALTTENTIEEWQEVLGCSYEYARQLWHKAGGKESKDDAEAFIVRRVLELKDKNISIRKIASELGISRGKVEGILKRSKVS